MKIPTYYKVQPGEPFYLPITKGSAMWCIKCCDCGLEHTIMLEPHKNKILVGVWRHDDLMRLTLPGKGGHKRAKQSK